ncbi:MAG: AlkZ family DNA glycosylase [Acidimicrobiia bacterium]|nr:AlkZ family DNA glycosylase [Acidimicrobiia bacterium]
MRTLSQRELLLALLDRQLLLRRSRFSIPRVLERMGGLQAQYAPSMYVGLWTRMAAFTRADLDAALLDRTVVQGTLLRSTIHLVTPADYWVFAAGIRESRKQWWLQSRKDDPAALDAAVSSLRALLRAPMKAKEIEAALGVKLEAFNQWTELVRMPPSGTWDRRRADLYLFAEDWIPRKHVSVADAADHLLRRYLGAFGPGAPSDIAGWAGVSPKQILAAVDRLRRELREYRSDTGAELLDLKGAKIPALDTEVPVRFLPVWDAVLLAHCRRTGILPEEFRKLLFNATNPQSFNTFLVDGRVAGTWKHVPTGIEIEPFGKLPAARRRELEAEAVGLAALYS